MTVTYFQETAKSRDAVIDLRAGSTTFNYMALVFPPYTVSDDQDVLAYAQANLTARYGFQLLRTLNLKSLGGPAWEVTGSYGFDEGDAVATPPGDPLPFEFSFDTTGGTQHITQSLSTVTSVKHGAPVNERTVNDLVTVGPRTVNDAVTALGINVLTSATAAFTSADLGAVLTSTTPGMLPATCTVTEVVNGTTVKLSSAALANVTSAGNLTISGVVISSATANFGPRDVGALVTTTAAGVLPAGATIAAVISLTQARISGGTVGASVSGAFLRIGALQPVNYGRAIGVSRDGVAGTDVIAPKLEFQMTRNFVGMTLSYIRTCHRLTGKINSSAFYGYSPGELLFLGASGVPSMNNQALAAPLCRVTFRFAGSANQEDLDLVPDDDSDNHLLRIPFKRGWDYLWVYYRDALDVPSNTIRPRPDAAYVERVYEEAEYGDLLIGTG